MTGALVVSQMLLWIAVGVLTVLVAALVRQVGVLHERIAPAGALMLRQTIAVGDPGPRMTLAALDGSQVRIGGSRVRSQLVVFVAPDCPLCKSLLPVVRSVRAAEADRIEVVLASDGDADAYRRFVTQAGLGDFVHVLSEELGRALGVSKLPHAVLIDPHGKIAAFGLVNSREHLESLLEAEERGVVSLQHYLAQR